jgi:manganese-transporting P-type ATPase
VLLGWFKDERKKERKNNCSYRLFSCFSSWSHCAGFAIFRSPLKPESEPTLRMLRDSQHQLVMITGDAPLTACHAAAQVHIVVRPPLILTLAGTPSSLAFDANASANGALVNDPSSLRWLSPDESTSEPFSADRVDALALSEAYDLCVSGDALTRLQALGAAADLYIPLTQVFARVTPEQKELVVTTMRAAGLTVLMCGDGTNDVGALKGAHVGVALLPPAPKLQQQAQQGAPQQQLQGRGAGRGGGRGPTLSGGRGLQGHSLQQQAQQGPVGQGPRPVQGPGSKLLEDMRRQGRPITPFVERMAKAMDDMGGATDGGGEVGHALRYYYY